MQTPSLIKRYLLIINKLKDEPNLKEFIQYFRDNGIDIAERTFRRYLKKLREEFGIAIEYNRSGKYYSINDDESINTESFYRLFENVELANIIREKTNGSGNISDYIDFEAKKADTKGNELISEILPAIIDYKIISFTYGKYYGDTTKKNKEIQPYFLKEYNYRWYVAGFEKGNNEHRVYGLDRIENLIISDETFMLEAEKKDYLKEGFNNTVGLAFNYHKFQEVKLWLNKEQYNYAESQPFHHSQKLIGEDEKGYTLSLKVHPNTELRLLIVQHGAHIKVIEPKWFADEVAEIHKKAAELYK